MRALPWRRGYSSFLVASTDLGYGQDTIFSSGVAACGRFIQHGGLILNL